uniref:Synaptotagmin-like protein 2 n=1 Tax=Amphilophus citrinellus TaxID=61819 RepID=A0A3Q0TEI4_AMPCI
GGLGATVTMIDLSFLTEEEQETILTVLKRDAELKKLEEQRIQNLQKTVSDKSRLRNLTGEWFYETKQLRHQDRIHGSDIIRASMMHTHKPLTIYINPHTIATEEQRGKLTPVQSQRNSPSLAAKETDSNPSTDTASCPLPENYFNAPQSKNDSEKKVGTLTPLARSFIPQGHQHYLGPQEKAHIPSFYQSKVSTAESDDDVCRPQSALRDFQEIVIQEPVDLLSSVMTKQVSSSSYPADFGEIEVQGSIQFAVNYIQKLGEFHIFVVHCRDLAVANINKHHSDPYVKCYLLPEKTKLGKRKTTVKKKTLNPTYNEILKFKVTMEILKTQNLNISVWHDSTFGRNSFLGEVNLNLSEWDFRNTQMNEYSSAEASALRLMDNRGQMRVALRFLLQTSLSKRTSRMESGEVQIWVKDCKNLPPVRGLMIDPFVKCTVLPDTSRKSRQKTRVVKRTANPMFNHTMVYDGFRPEDLREACIEITVWDHDRLNNHYIGGLRLGLGTGKSYGVEVAWMDSTTDEMNLWQRMLQSDGEWVEDVLPLRMLMMATSLSK